MLKNMKAAANRVQTIGSILKALSSMCEIPMSFSKVDESNNTKIKFSCGMRSSRSSVKTMRPNER